MKRIIGLDLGHCEIAAATPNYEGGKFVNMNNLFLDGDKNAVIPAEVEYHGELFNYFKASPKYFDEKIQGDENEISRRDLMTSLLNKVIRGIKEYNTTIAAGDQILLIVGCPTSKEWTSEKNRKEYEQLIKKATGVAEVRVVPESRAAMFSALADGKGRMISACDGAVVYDFGSSTADSTYMKTGKRCVELSWDLGAREVEKALRKLMCREAAQKAAQKGVELIPQENYSNLERKLRAAKEAYFNGTLDEDSCVVAWKFPTMGGKKLTVTLDIDNNTMREALEKEEISLEVNGKLITGSWKSCCKEFFRTSKKLIENANHSVKEIVLTGGASKMDFVLQYAQEIFPKSFYTVTCAKNPSFSVSQGLVWVGLVDELEQECISIVKKSVIDSGAGSVLKLKNSLKENMGEKIYQAVLDSVGDWANASKDESLNDLQNRMNHKVSYQMPVIQSINKTCITEWSDNIIRSIRKQLEKEIQKNLGTALAQKIKMPESKWKTLNQSLDDVGIDTEKIISGIDVNGILNNVIMLAIIVSYIAIGTVLIPIPIIGSGIGALIGGALASCLNDEDRYKARKQRVRKSAKKAMLKNDEKVKILEMCHAQINDTIDAQITDASVADDIKVMVKKAYETMTLKFEI